MTMKKMTISLTKKTLRTIGEVKRWFDDLDTSLFLVFDTETFGLYYNTPLLGMSFFQEGEAVYIPMYNNPDYFAIRDYIKSIIHNFNLVAHNGLFDKVVFYHRGFGRVKIWGDSMILAHVWDTSLDKNLEILTKKNFRVSKKTFKEITGKKWDNIDWEESYEEYEPLLADYACEDVYWTYRLYLAYYEKVASDPKLLKIYESLELPLIEVLFDAKVRGVRINRSRLSEIEVEVRAGIEELTESIYESTGYIFNLSSPKQKADIFFNKLGYSPISETATGNPSTDSDTMEALAALGCEPAGFMVEHSVLNKLHTSYCLNIPELLDEHDILRGNLNSCGTRSGRFSSNDPNLQNMPSKNPRYPIRECFIPREGYAFACLDFSQIEPRLMAHMSRDEGLIAIYEQSGDIYQGVADDLGITRKQAKVVVLAISYGMGPKKLANDLGITKVEAQAFIDSFYRKYPKFAAWKKHVEQSIKKNQYVRTAFGRVRRLPEVAHYKTEFEGLRKGFNTMVQGSAADFIKIVMVSLYEDLKEKLEEWDACMVLQVHDELLVECKVEYIKECYQLVKDRMENIIKFRVPIIADGVCCWNWWQMKTHEKEPPFSLIENSLPAQIPIKQVNTENNLLNLFLCQ